jgi:xanthine dehydrogenase YagS FAD-binding subunit
MIKNFAYVKAGSVAAAVKALSTKGSLIHAGGTDLLGCLRENLMPAEKIISIGGIKEMQGISARPDGGLRIGALTTLAEVSINPAINERYAVLAQAASRAASPQLRNQGTIGGNLCQRPRCWYFRGDFPCFRKGGNECFALQGENQFHAIFNNGACFYVHPSDTAVALTALQAQVVAVKPSGTRTIRIENFFVTPEEDITRETVLAANEIVTEIRLPASAVNTRSSYRKIGTRQAWDFASVSVAVVLQFAEQNIASARIVLGGVAYKPWRVESAEKLLVGQRIDRGTADAAAKAALDGAQPMRDNEYKISMARGAIAESLLALAGGSMLTS